MREWLASYGLSADEQWSVGFGLAAMTQAFTGAAKPRTLEEHVDDLLAKLRLPDASRDLPVISASREEFQAQFAALRPVETPPWPGSYARSSRGCSCAWPAATCCSSASRGC